MSHTTIVAVSNAGVPQHSHHSPHRRFVPDHLRWNIAPRFQLAIRSICAIAIAVALLQAGSHATAALITLQEGLDGYHHNDAFVRNDGTNGNAANNTTRVLAGSVGSGSSPSGPLRAIFSFPLSGIPAGSTINSVLFRVGRDSDTGTSVPGDYTVELRTISDTFNEATATWNNTFGSSMTLGGTVLSSTTMNPESPAATVSIHDFLSSSAFVAAVQAAVDASQPFNFALVAPAAVETGASRVIFRIGSNTSVPPGNPPPPLLEIDYSLPVPEPTAMVLLSMAGGCLLFQTRSLRSSRVS